MHAVGRAEPNAEVPAQAQQRIKQLEGHLLELEQKKAGLKQRSQDLLRAPVREAQRESPERRQRPVGRDGQHGPGCMHYV